MRVLGLTRQFMLVGKTEARMSLAKTYTARHKSSQHRRGSKARGALYSTGLRRNPGWGSADKKPGIEKPSPARAEVSEERAPMLALQATEDAG